MRQAQLLAPKKIELRDLPTPAPRAGEVLVRVRAALTCGTDLKTYRRGHPKLAFGPFGHEASGDVIAVGEGVRKVQPGEAIMWVQTAPCGQCTRCTSGDENLCEHLFDEIALGAYADHLILPKRVVQRNVFPKPAHLSYIEAAFLEPFACVVHGWRVLARANAQRPTPRSVAIIGAGTIGLLHVLYAKHAGVPATVFARSEHRGQLALRVGAANVVDRAVPGPDTGFEAVIECAGTPETWSQAVELAESGGRVLFFGGLAVGSLAAIDATRVHYDELTLLGAFHFTPSDVREAREIMVSKTLDLRPLVDGVEPLEALPDVFARLDGRRGYKYALVPETSETSAPRWV